MSPFWIRVVYDMLFDVPLVLLAFWIGKRAGFHNGYLAAYKDYSPLMDRREEKRNG